MANHQKERGLQRPEEWDMLRGILGLFLAITTDALLPDLYNEHPFTLMMAVFFLVFLSVYIWRFALWLPAQVRRLLTRRFKKPLRGP